MVAHDHALPAPHGDDASHHGDHEEHHDESSIWPTIAASCLGLMLLGFALSFGGATHAGMLLSGFGIALVGLASASWWADMVHFNKNPHTTLVGTPTEVQRALRIGFLFFLGSEVAFFGAFFAFYFYSRLHAVSWPPPGFEPLEIWPLPTLNTALLVTSGFLYTVAEHNIQHNRPERAPWWIGGSLLLGLVFLGVQAYEWAHMPFSVSDGVFGTSFFLLTGFHGAHVIVGATMLTVMFVRSIFRHFAPGRDFGLVAAGWYWHFVDVVWIFLYFVLYMTSVTLMVGAVAALVSAAAVMWAVRLIHHRHA